ncbi:MAG: RnfABCDGE type electron transport complex subunit G [Candidatus Omnitrophica bacterium]|nr:RnfABCDGE type electron transport complex subunit G [Candidatus Omnitrophota bacterium]
MLRFGIILMLVCLVASSILAITYKITYPKIVSQKYIEEKGALKTVFSDADEFKKTEDYYTAYKNKLACGYILKIYTRGYSSSPIEILVGFDTKGTIEGLVVLAQSETPGLGARITEIKSGEKDAWFLTQFKNKIAQKLDYNKINAISGATITSRAVTEAVKTEVKKFLDKK